LQRIVEDFEDECAREHSSPTCRKQRASTEDDKMTRQREYFAKVEEDRRQKHHSDKGATCKPSQKCAPTSSQIPKPKTIARRRVSRVKRSTKDETDVTSGADDWVIDSDAHCTVLPDHYRSSSVTKAICPAEHREVSNPEASRRERRSGELTYQVQENTRTHMSPTLAEHGEVTNPEASRRGRRSSSSSATHTNGLPSSSSARSCVGSITCRVSSIGVKEKSTRRVKANKMSQQKVALPAGDPADSSHNVANHAKDWLDDSEPQRSIKPAIGIEEDIPTRNRTTKKRHNKIAGAKHQRARSEPAQSQDIGGRNPMASKSFLRFSVDAGNDSGGYNVKANTASASTVNSVDDFSYKTGVGDHEVDSSTQSTKCLKVCDDVSEVVHSHSVCNSMDGTSDAPEPVTCLAGSLGTKLEEMAVAVARLDAVLYVESCHVSNRAKSSQSITPPCNYNSTISSFDVASSPHLDTNLKECLDRNTSDVNEIEVVRHTKQTTKQENMEHKQVEQMILSKVEDDISRAFSSATCGTAKIMANKGTTKINEKRSSAPSVACSVSTAASMASEASGSEQVSDDDTSVSGPSSSRRSRSSLVQRAGVLADFFALKQKEVGSSIGRVVRRQKHASQRPSKDGHYNTVPAKVSSDVNPNVPSLTSFEGIAQGKNDRDAEPRIRQSSVSSANECALCGGPVAGEGNSCFCIPCAARLEVLDSSPQKKQSTADPKEPCETQQHVATPLNEVSYCVLCNSQFICNVDASSSVVCSRCLGQPSGSPKVGSITNAKT